MLEPQTMRPPASMMPRPPPREQFVGTIRIAAKDNGNCAQATIVAGNIRDLDWIAKGAE